MEQPKRILILTADVGFGHRKAALAMEAALMEAYSGRCEVIVANPLDDPRTPAILKDSQADYDRLVREMPDVYKLQYEFSDAAVPNAIVERAVTVMLFRVIQDLLRTHRPDAVVMTHPLYPAPVGAVIAMRRLNIPAITVATDLTNVHRLWLNDRADMILLPTGEAARQAVEAGVRREKLRVTGIPVHPAMARDAVDKAELRRGLGWQVDLTTAVVVGSKRVKHLEKTLHVLNHSGLPLQLVVVTGGDEELYQQFRRVEWHAVTQVYNLVENMPDFLLAADLVLCKAGGLITTEALACGLPMLLIDVTPGQEEGNAGYVLKYGAADRAETPVDALEVLFHWLQNDCALLAERARNAKAAGKPRSAFLAAEIVMQLAESGPPALPAEGGMFLSRLRELLAQFGISGEA